MTRGDARTLWWYDGGEGHRLNVNQARHLRWAEIGAYDSMHDGAVTRTVRLLGAQGLLAVTDDTGDPWIRWKVTGLTVRGRQVLTEWRQVHGQ